MEFTPFQEQVLDRLIGRVYPGPLSTDFRQSVREAYGSAYDWSPAVLAGLVSPGQVVLREEGQRYGLPLPAATRSGTHPVPVMILETMALLGYADDTEMAGDLAEMKPAEQLAFLESAANGQISKMIDKIARIFPAASFK
jgi:hypothetical protein